MGALWLWIRGLNPASRSFTVTAEFDRINGVQPGTTVRYRGVAVGRISRLTPLANGVEVKLDISPADLIIPQDSELEVNQSGLLGETLLDLMPRKPLPEGAVASKPLDQNCDRSVILCDGSRIRGRIGISTDELLRATIKFAEVYSNPQFTGNITRLTKNSSDAAAEIAALSREVTSLVKSAQREVGTFSQTARSIGSAADRAGIAADRAVLTIDQVSALVADNRTTLVSTLENINALSVDLRSTVAKVSPLVDRVAQGQMLQNLETLSANAAQASANFRDVSATLNNSTNLALLQQTLDSARLTFQNAQKILSDLDELTGDPKVRDNLRRLINGLSGLVSSTNQLDQQAQMAAILSDPVAVQQLQQAIAQDRAARQPQPTQRP
jgi:phospholipid/cholesterol/gamma-HCH transport system substrate-binding protein